MRSIDERLARTRENLKQLENQKKEQVKRERLAKQKADLCRDKTVGALFVKHFPDVMALMPRRIVAENLAEFAPVDDFFSALAADEDWVMLLKAEVSRRASPDNRQVDPPLMTNEGGLTDS